MALVKLEPTTPSSPWEGFGALLGLITGQDEVRALN